MNGAREEERRPRVDKEGWPSPPPAMRKAALQEKAEERGRLQPEAPGTLSMSRSAAEAYKMLKAADAGR